MQKYLFICLLLVACTPEKQSLQATQQSTPCEFPSWETMQASLPDQLFCYDSNKTNIQVTALLIASAEGNLTVIQDEIARGSNVNFQGKLKGYTPLSYATIKEHIAAVKLLLENGANSSISLNSDGKTPASTGASPLFIAVDRGNYEITKLLLEHGADPNIRSSDNGLTGASNGSPPLTGIAQKGQIEIAKLLLKHGADPNMARSGNGKTRASDGATPLILAVEFEHIEMVQLLLDYGAEPSIPAARDGGTALMLAATRNSLEIARLLLENGADANQLNKQNGHQPLDYAEQSAMVKLLKEYGAFESLRASVDKLGKRGH